MIAIAAHLWQSTLFCVAAAVLTLVFRASQAQVRYWIWLSASLKFLLPFALLTSLGSHIQMRTPFSVQEIAATVPVFSHTLGYFSRPVLPQVAASGPASSGPTLSIDLLILGVWGCGVISLALIRLRGWRRIQQVVRASLATNIPVPVEVRSSPGLSEPGVVGLIRPVLLLPQGITERLTPSEMNAILAHELCHVRRRDNLLAFLHMVAETMFWFHPLMWWIGARLLEERETACDEDVLSRGVRPDVYADAILSVCRLYVESPRFCACGVTSATLKRRIEVIMSNRVAEKLDGRRKILLAAAGAAAVALPMLVGSLDAPRLSAQTAAEPWPKFAVTSVKPNKTNCCVSGGVGNGGSLNRNLTLRMLIGTAYRVQEFQISGGPGWIASDRFDVEGKAEDPKADFDQLRLMLRSLLEDRFKLKLHRETTESPVYALVVGKDGPKIRSSADQTSPDVNGPSPPEATGPNHGAFRFAPGSMIGNAVHLSLFTRFLSQRLDRLVIDKTKLTGRFDIQLQWTPDIGENPLDLGGNAIPPADPSRPSIFAAIQEQLGLRLEPTKAPVEVLVIDHVEKPSAN